MLDVEFFKRDAETVAKELIGKILYSRLSGDVVEGIIVETEAYMGPEDKAAHARHGRTKRNEALFTGPGLAYPHLIHGIHWLLNVTVGPVGGAQGVLIRAVQPIDSDANPNGPGKVGKFFGVSNAWYALDMCSSDLGFRLGGNLEVARTPRIGISKFSDDWTDKPLRFIAVGNPFVSGKKSLNESAESIGVQHVGSVH